MLTRSGNTSTLVYILLTCGACVPWWAGAGSLPCHRVGITPGPRVARIPQTLVLQVAEQSSLSRGTFALIAPNLVMTSSSVQTRISCTVVFVLLAVLPNKPIHTNTLVTTFCVLAGAVVLAGVV